MFACPTCATPVAGSEPACPACGSDLDIAESPTGTAPHPASPRTPSSGEKPRTPSNGGGRLVRRAVRARDRARRPLPDRRPAGPRRDGRGLPRRRPQARAAGRAQVPAARPRQRRRAARALLPRGARRAPRVARGRVPGLRRGRGGGPLLHLDGARGRREPRLAAAPDRAAAAGQGARDRAPAVRGARRGAREGRAAPGPEARERDARRPGQRAHHRLRPGRPRRVAAPRRRALGDAQLHVAGAAPGARGHGPERHLLARPRALRALHGPARLRGQVARGVHAQAPRRAADRALGARGRARPGGRAGDPELPREGAEAAAVVPARRRRDAHGARPARGRARGGGDAVARDRGRGRRGARPAPGLRLGPAGPHARRPRARAAHREHVPAAGDGPRRQAAGRARRPRARLHPAHGAGSLRRGRHLGPRRGVGLHRLRGREGPLVRPLGRPRGRKPSGAPVLVPAEPAAARVDAAERQGVLDEAGPRRERHGRRHLRHGGAAAAVLLDPAAARARARGARGRARLVDALLRGPPRPGLVPRGDAAMDALLLRRHARRVGGILAGPARHQRAHRGGGASRPPGVVRDRLALDASRADGVARAGRRPSSCARRSS